MQSTVKPCCVHDKAHAFSTSASVLLKASHSARWKWFQKTMKTSCIIPGSHQSNTLSLCLLLKVYKSVCGHFKSLMNYLRGTMEQCKAELIIFTPHSCVLSISSSLHVKYLTKFMIDFVQVPGTSQLKICASFMSECRGDGEKKKEYKKMAYFLFR